MNDKFKFQRFMNLLDVRIQITDKIRTKEVAWLKLRRNSSGEKTILCGITLESTQGQDGAVIPFEMHATYHQSGEYHIRVTVSEKRKKNSIQKCEPIDAQRAPFCLLKPFLVISEVDGYPGKEPKRKKGVETITIDVNEDRRALRFYELKMLFMPPSYPFKGGPGDQVYIFDNVVPWIAIVVSKWPSSN